jgi:hypothetical protein
LVYVAITAAQAINMTDLVMQQSLADNSDMNDRQPGLAVRYRITDAVCDRRGAIGTQVLTTKMKRQR